MRRPRVRATRLAPVLCALLFSAVLAGCVPRVVAPPVPVPLAAPSTIATSRAATESALAIEPSASAEASTPAPPPPSAPSVTPAPARRDPRLYPDPRLTPGDVLAVSAAQVSVPGYASKARNVPVAEKRAVFAEYALAYPQKAGAFECDHFIPLCLGGSNSAKNLWPEPAPQFHWKDGLELYLWHEVRARRISLAEAQREIRTDWYAYWVKAGRPGSAGDADSAAVQAVAVPAAARASGVVGWSVSGARYHKLTCRYFAQIKPANRRTGSVAQARADGKTPCRVCRPPE